MYALQSLGLFDTFRDVLLTELPESILETFKQHILFKYFAGVAAMVGVGVIPHTNIIQQEYIFLLTYLVSNCLTHAGKYS